MKDDTQAASVARRLFNPYGLRAPILVLYHVLVLSLSIFTIDRIAAHLFLPAENSREILLVASPNCPHSRAVRARLVDSGIPFREITTGQSPVRRALAAWAFQSLAVPIVVVGSEVIYGNQRERIDDSLVGLGYAPAAVNRLPSAEAQPGESLRS